MATVALILLCEEDIDPTGSDVRCVRNERICDIILQLYLSAQCQINPLTKIFKIIADVFVKSFKVTAEIFHGAEILSANIISAKILVAKIHESQ